MEPQQLAARAARIDAGFADIHPPLTPQQAVLESDRCYFCHDAPCVEACPTAIDVPRFIRGIATGNLRGAATTILDANILGGSCARVCPTEILCEQACVRNAELEPPIRIGALQRHATDWMMRQSEAPYTQGEATGRRIAVVGAGPAGLSCAHRLALLGHSVTIFEARPKPGGLNEYGIAAYKMTDDFAQREVAFILSVGGITIEYDQTPAIDDLLARFDAVFLGIGQAGVRQLALEGAGLSGVRDAVGFIAELRQSSSPAAIPVGRRVVVIGGGNTAVDAAVQARRLGAAEVTIAYRRGADRMSATVKEQGWARANDVRLRDCLAPVALQQDAGRISGVAFAASDPHTGAPLAGAEPVVIAADLVLCAIGQTLAEEALRRTAAPLAIENGRIVVDADRRTNVARLYAGGDCVAGADLTVAAVQDGKLAALAIHRDLG